LGAQPRDDLGDRSVGRIGLGFMLLDPVA